MINGPQDNLGPREPPNDQIPHERPDGQGPWIGVRDSGVGGLTVARAIRAALPGARLLYFADTAHVPYGDRAPAEVTFYALSISRFLIEAGAAALVFACNTTSAYALTAARERFDVPVWGVIEPGARAAARVSSGRIGVLATGATVASGVYGRVLRLLRPDVEVREIACPAFVPLVEARRTASLEAREAARHYLAPLEHAGVDTVILGCTHYPLLLEALRAVAPDLHFIDPARELASEVAASIEARHGSAHGAAHGSAHGSARAQSRLWASGPADGVREWARELLGHDGGIEIGPCFHWSGEDLPRTSPLQTSSPPTLGDQTLGDQTLGGERSGGEASSGELVASSCVLVPR